MCGISGIFSSRLSSEEQSVGVRRMLHAMRRRGPDGQGVFEGGPCTLGHARLAVIDTTTAGAQPMTQDGVTLIFNGELYTFQQERRQLEEQGAVFTSSSDAEVLLKLYLQHGLECFQRLRGMYAFALWDARNGTLVCARDPLGIKPFLYAATSQGFVFASELKGLLASGLVPKDVDRQALRCLLQRGSVSQPASILHGVQWLLPGHLLLLREGEAPQIRCFSSLRTGTIDVSGATWDELLAEGRTRLLTALERQMIADVPLGAFLSGGIDSSLLVALMSDLRGRVRTFSVGFESGLDTASEDETRDAEAVARHLHVEHSTIIVRREEIADNLRAIVAGLDHPTVDGVNSWFVARAASSELTVAVSGTGGDELFAGYPWFSAMRRWADAPLLTRIRRGLGGENFLSAFDEQYRIFSHTEASRICQGTLPPAGRPDPLPQADVFNRVSGLVLQGYTRDQLLADIDTAAMWHGLEVRVPLLDEDLLDFALSLPPEAKVGGSIAVAPEGSYADTGVKRLLLALGEPLLPPGFSQRAKRGFGLPFDAWLRTVLAPQMDELLSESVVRKRGFFEPHAVAAVQHAFLHKRSPWIYPWLLMVTELWAQEVLDA